MNRLKTIKMLLMTMLLMVITANAEDGSRLWLRYDTLNTCRVEKPNIKTPTTDIAAQELHAFCRQSEVKLNVDASLNNELGEEGFSISGSLISAATDRGLLYGAYELLRRQQLGLPLNCKSAPQYSLRLLNHWDNLDGSIERGYAGKSIFWGKPTPQAPSPRDGEQDRIVSYARANASIGINGTVLNNVNASPKMLTREYINKVKEYADLFRPYGIRVYLSINFATPLALKETKTADPLDPKVQQWWQRKVKEIYSSIPDFGGFLVKANSEGQPGPFDYGRSHADGANMLARALRPYNGIVMWRCFVYGSKHKGEDRVKQAVSEFEPLDGEFLPNVILQTKNGPLDFQPREPYSPIFDRIKKTPNMAELQITQEYLGQSRQLVYLAPMWQEFFETSKAQLKGIAGVANIGDDTNWTGHHFSQANWYAYGRMAWNTKADSRTIADEWLHQTFAADDYFYRVMTDVMMESHEACVDYMMPLGLHHIFKFDHHLGPEPDGFIKRYPLEWCPVYYHKANRDSIGFDRTVKTGTGATAQYRPKVARMFENIETCPDEYLLWFHRVPWTHPMRSGLTLWQEMQLRYNRGAASAERFQQIWQNVRSRVRDNDQRRLDEISERMQWMTDDAREWRDVCLRYFGSFTK